MTKLALEPTMAPCFLHPGDVALGLRGERFETLLGSCVCIILTDPRRTLAAICHFVHASFPASGERAGTAHASPALDWMFQALRQQGIEPRLCEAYVVGGGNMFPWLGGSGPHVGDRNVSWALDTLHDEGIPVLAQETGGTGYRRLGWTVGPGDPEVTTIEV